MEMRREKAADYLQKVGDMDFKGCWYTIKSTHDSMRIALSSVIGGLLLGFNTGVISSALPYIKNNSRHVTEDHWLQAFLVGAAAAGAFVSLTIVGRVNDRLGPKTSLLFADFLSIIGIIVSVFAMSPVALVIGRIFVGLAVGMTFVTLPLYVSEAFSSRYLGVLFCTNSLLITVGQFFSNFISLVYTEKTHPWRWMVGFAIYPTFIHLCLLQSLYECPKWYYQKGEKYLAYMVTQHTYYTFEEAKEAFLVMDLSIDAEKAVGGSLLEGNVFTKIRKAPSNILRRLLFKHIALQAAQQLAGINVVINFGPTIIQMAGTTLTRTALMLSLVPSGLNVVASIISISFVDRYRRKRMITSLFGTFICLLLLSGVLHSASVKASCGVKNVTRNGCPAADGLLDTNWYLVGDGYLIGDGQSAAILLGAYVIFYSIGLGTIPLIRRSKMRPLEHRDIRIGVTSALDWLWNFILSLLFLFFVDLLGSAGTFMLFAGFSLISLVLVVCT
ncbi:inositol transporter 4-like [Cornus florida]|uniref:inositol transporter 4-like n=1 Tax=Cornus florida TaxID=4283 RepID=UPI0028A1C0B1|nr:inositol transporter 4-like [Cornus florida]XP_059670417.1 inositol transporter 4-like [Cornus florida]